MMEIFNLVVALFVIHPHDEVVFILIIQGDLKYFIVIGEKDVLDQGNVPFLALIVNRRM